MKLMRTLVVLAAATGVVLVLAASAAADLPSKEVAHVMFEFDDTGTCPGTTIHWAYDEVDTLIEFSPTKQLFRRHGAAILSANGKTLTHNFSASVFFDPTTDVVKVTGTIFNIQAPGVGNLLLDSGSIVVDYSTDPPTVVHIGGPHPAFAGDVAALCAYLADP
jgi:hypothetical protein